MQQWEYLCLEMMAPSYVNTINGYTDFDKVLGLSSRCLWDVADRLGKDGWELVAADNHVYTFKRPKPIEVKP